MIKNGRIYIYTSLCLVFVTYNFIFEMVFTSIEEAIFESFVIGPMILVFLLIIYWTRLKVLSSKFAINYIKDNRAQKNKFIVALIFFKTLIISILSRVFSLLAFDIETGQHVFDVLFFTLLISILVVIIFIYFFEEYVTSIKERHNAILELTNHKLEKSYIKYLSLKRQLNPHFLFNSFNSLMALIPTDQNKAEIFLAELSKIYRYNLSQSDNIVVKLSEELGMIRSYVALQKIRFGEALNYNESLDANPEKLLMPPMTLQLLIENALKHNIVNKVNPLTVSITVLEDEVIVKNNFQPRDSESKVESFGIGLESIKKQLELVTDQQLKISMENQHYTVSVPIIKTEIDD